MIEHNLKEYRPNNTTSFIGRIQGEEVRKKLDLETSDEANDEIMLKLPADTTSFNPSFFLGLLYRSIKKMGLEAFKKKYHFVFETEDQSMQAALNKNIEDGYRNAMNSLDNRNGISVFG